VSDELGSSGQHKSLRLFGCWDLRVGGRPVRMAGREQRLVAYVALNGRRMRSYVAGILWPDSTESHAQSSLRAALLQVRRTSVGLLDADQTTVDIAPDVDVDVREFHRCASEVAANPDGVDFEAAMGILDGGDLTPGWYEDWVMFERERLQHERVRALEALAAAELRRGCGDAALTAARAATAVEPLRESAHSIVIRAHLMVGNVADAVHEYRAYGDLLTRELGINPSEQLRQLVTPLLVQTGAAHG
jgi:DNA-binding SARP family transcriptional activator